VCRAQCADALVLKVHTGTLAERPFELLEAFL